MDFLVVVLASRFENTTVIKMKPFQGCSYITAVDMASIRGGTLGQNIQYITAKWKGGGVHMLTVKWSAFWVVWLSRVVDKQSLHITAVWICWREMQSCAWCCLFCALSIPWPCSFTLNQGCCPRKMSIFHSKSPVAAWTIYVQMASVKVHPKSIREEVWW